MINIFIGYDERMPLLHNVLSYSILSQSSLPVTICPINLKNLSSIFLREIDSNQSTQFSFSRFLVPYLSSFQGWSIFMDNDMVCMADIAELWKLRDEKYSVMCVKHDYEVNKEVKFLGEKQTQYEKKNWSSLMLINNKKCKALTTDYVNKASGLELHQFKWLESDELIGELPKEWNYLAGYYPETTDAKLIHYTDGGPYFKAYQDSDFAKQWLGAREKSLYIQQE